MLLFPVIAAFVCYLCYRFRRRFVGVLTLMGCVACVITLSMLDRAVRVWFDLGDSLFSNLQWLLWMEAAALTALGTFFLSLPRYRASVPCRRCRYELAGLEHDNPTCPECGLTFAARKLRARRCPRCGERSPMDPVRPVCMNCAAHETNAIDSVAAGVKGRPADAH